ncbi:MAG TPA: hypothetical protein VJ779_04140 [Acetobacteraceae bacterium]|nr:hypothetical protein [Acetobacteraceae bacterium]
MRAPFAPRDLHDLRDVVFGVTATGIEAYTGDLRAAGFVGITVTDLTGDWAPYALARLAAWRENHANYTRVHGEAPMPRKRCSTR